MTEGVCLYAGALRGLFVWRAKNGAWEEVRREFPDSIIDAIASCPSHPEHLLVGATHDGLYRSQDAGKSWVKVLDGDMRAVALSPTDENIFYAGTEPVRLYRSEDHGKSWEELTSLTDLPEGVRKHWSFPQPPHQGHVRAIFIHPEDSRIIYLSIEHGGIVRSLDGGKSWTDVSSGIDYLDIHQVSTLPRSFDRYYASTAQGFFTSEDPARGWTRSETGYSRDFFSNFVFLPPIHGNEEPTILIATADKSPGYWAREKRGARAAVFRSGDCGRSWHRVGKGLPDELDPMIWGLVNHPKDPNGAFAGLGEVNRGGASPEGGAGMIYVTHDRGESWQKLDISVSAIRSLWATVSQ